jgi:hypothetical protein
VYVGPYLPLLVVWGDGVAGSAGLLGR